MAKRIFDIFFSIIGLLAFGWLVFIFFLIASFDTKQNGIFTQFRIGQHGRKFKIYKLRTISRDGQNKQNISAVGQFLRRTKIDELPQLFNIFSGDMSFVGPRPDIPGYYDCLQGENKLILQMRPGITGPASLKYANEEVMLSQQHDPVHYNDTVIFPDKVRINLEYLKNRSFWGDVKIIWDTLFRMQN